MARAVIVNSPTEEAIRILLEWHANSSKVRMTFANDNIFVTCHGRVYNAGDPSWIWCIGDETGDEMRFDLEGAVSIALTSSGSTLRTLDSMIDAVDEFLSVTWADGARLYLVREKRRGTIV